VLTSRKGQLIAQIEQKESDLSRLKEEVQSLAEEVAAFPASYTKYSVGNELGATENEAWFFGNKRTWSHNYFGGL